jgi:hypothetical protein
MQRHAQGRYPILADAIRSVLDEVMRRELAQGQARHVSEDTDEFVDAADELSAVRNQVAEDGISPLERTPEDWLEILQNFFVLIPAGNETRGSNRNPNRTAMDPAFPPGEATTPKGLVAPERRTTPSRAKSAQNGGDGASRKRRGRPPNVYDAAYDRYLELLRDRSITPQQLGSEKTYALPGLWGVKGSRNTLSDARDAAVAKFEEEQADTLNF